MVYLRSVQNLFRIFLNLYRICMVWFIVLVLTFSLLVSCILFSVLYSFGFFLTGMLMDSLAGSLLFTFLHALLLLPVSIVHPLLPQLLALLSPIDKLNRLLPPLPDDDTGILKD